MKPERDSPMPTLADVAQLAGVNKSTASRALRKCHHVKDDTRTKVLAAADTLGYQPDPSVSLLAARRWRSEGGAPREVLPFVARVRDADSEALAAHVRRLGAKFGYNVETHYSQDYVSIQSLVKALDFRGVRKVVLHGFTSRAQLVGLPFSRYVSVSCGTFLEFPICSIVLNWEWMLEEAVRRLRANGVERASLVINGPESPLTSCLEQRFTQLAQAHASDMTLTVCKPRSGKARLSHDVLMSWIARYKPCAILGIGVEALDLIRRSGLQMPEDCCYVGLSVNGTRQAHVSGFEPGEAMLAEKALQVLQRPQLFGGERVDRMEICQVVPGWRDGKKSSMLSGRQTLAASA